MKNTFTFPSDFLWGAATASFQVEGYPLADGAGPSNWSDFCFQPGRIANDDNGEIGPAHYKKYKEDVQMMKALGLKAYRFSINWARIFPEGTGRVNEKGVAFYNSLINELLDNGIEPWVTFFHWDLPLALEKKGGWTNRDTVVAFADYVSYMTKRISDRVKNFFTINEILCFTTLGYEHGIHAPGLKLDAKTCAQTVHHGVLAHGLAVQAIRAAADGPVNIGLAENLVTTVPMFGSEAHIEATRKAVRFENADKLTAIMEGQYLDSWLEKMGGNAPQFTDSEMLAIGSEIDFVGVNIYFPEIVEAADNENGYRIVPKPEGYPKMDMPWLHIGPEITYWIPRLLNEVWGVDAVYITENGCATQDKMAQDGEIYDTDRVMYLKHHFMQASRAVQEGWPLKGYFVWSLMDNFEWSYGYQKRFGLHYVNYSTLERIPKTSAKFYKEVIATNQVV